MRAEISQNEGLDTMKLFGMIVLFATVRAGIVTNNSDNQQTNSNNPSDKENVDEDGEVFKNLATDLNVVLSHHISLHKTFVS